MDIGGKLRNFLEKLQSLSDSKKKATLWVIVGILAVAMGFFWTKTTINRLSTMPGEIQSIKFPEINMPEGFEMPSLDNLKTITADWKTYTNIKYGFEVKYPSSFSAKEDVSKVGYISVAINDGVEDPFVIYVGDTKAGGINDILNPKSSDYNEIKNGKITVNDISWNTIEENDIPVEGVGAVASNLYAYVAKGGTIYVFRCINCNADMFGIDGVSKKAIFDQIISTFKFTK